MSIYVRWRGKGKRARGMGHAKAVSVESVGADRRGRPVGVSCRAAVWALAHFGRWERGVLEQASLIGDFVDIRRIARKP